MTECREHPPALCHCPAFTEFFVPTVMAAQFALMTRRRNKIKEEQKKERVK